MQRQDKKKVFEAHGTHSKDTGSPAVQVALFSHRIKQLTNHLQTHKKDRHSRRGLLALVSKRRKTLNYLARMNKKLYQGLIKQLGLRK